MNMKYGHECVERRNLRTFTLPSKTLAWLAFKEQIAVDSFHLSLSSFTHVRKCTKLKCGRGRESLLRSPSIAWEYFCTAIIKAIVKQMGSLPHDRQPTRKRPRRHFEFPRFPHA